MFQKVVICGLNTASLKTLSCDEMDELLKKADCGDERAREDLICGNIRLVLSVIQRFSRRGVAADDLFQVGCVGLIKAIDNFDLSQNVRFSTYAVPMIVGEVRRYLRDNNMIRVSRSVRDLAYQAMREKEHLSIKLGRDPTPEEITEAINCVNCDENIDSNNIHEGGKMVSVRSVVAALDAVVEPVSLYEPIYSDGGDAVSLIDQIFDTKNTPDVLMEDLALKEALAHLGEREKQIIGMRYYLGKTQVEVAREIGISQAQVSRLEKSAIDHIRSQM